MAKSDLKGKFMRFIMDLKLSGLDVRFIQYDQSKGYNFLTFWSSNSTAQRQGERKVLKFLWKDQRYAKLSWY
jgi:hypothetical protein